MCKLSIKNIIFDFGGVLIDWNPRYFYREVFGDWNKADAFINNICTNDWNAQMDAGRTFAECIKEKQAEHPEYAEEIGLYYEGWPKMLNGTIPEGMDILRQLQECGRFNLYGLTNWSHETIGYAREHFPFINEFKDVIVSGEEKMRKPEPLIFERLIHRTGIVARESVFIDDTLRNVKASRAMGIAAIHCTDFNQVKAELTALTGFKFS